MSDPSDFISFSEYLGLNEGAGQQMLDKTMAGGDKLRSEVEAANAEQWKAAKSGTEKQFADAGERSRKGLASYGEFMKALSDPTDRQALMEKTYGKGAVSALDSAMMGSSGAGRIAQGQKDLASMDRSGAMKTRRDGFAADAAVRATAEGKYKDEQKAAHDARERQRLGREWARARFDKGNYGESDVDAKMAGMGQRERDMAIDKQARKWNAYNNGQIDWTRYGMAQEAEQRYRLHADQKMRGGLNIDLSFGKGKVNDMSGDTWDAYYTKNQKPWGG